MTGSPATIRLAYVTTEYSICGLQVSRLGILNEKPTELKQHSNKQTALPWQPATLAATKTFPLALSDIPF